MSDYSVKHILQRRRQDEQAERAVDLLMQEVQNKIFDQIDANFDWNVDAYRDAMRDMGNVTVLDGDYLDTDEFWNSGSGAPE